MTLLPLMCSTSPAVFLTISWNSLCVVVLWNVADEHTSGHRRVAMALIALIALIAPMALAMGRLLLVRHADKWMRGEWPAAWAACHERRPTVNKMA